MVSQPRVLLSILWIASCSMPFSSASLRLILLVLLLISLLYGGWPADELLLVVNVALALLGSGSLVDRSGTYVLLWNCVPVQSSSGAPFDRPM